MPSGADGCSWPSATDELIAAQRDLAARTPEPWTFRDGCLLAGCWACFPLGATGPGAAAALWAAGGGSYDVYAVVSRGGRADLAADRLPRVTAPTLLIVGERDPEVLELNRRAQRELRGPNALEIVPGASHLFEEKGTLERVAELARDWFATRLPER